MLAPDQAVRDRAIGITESFIVQAPAGAGKTSLLTQRILNLLTIVENPEEIIAVTFTRKAAAEMRQRLLDALHKAKLKEPEVAYEKRSWRLAQKVLQRDQELNWQLFKNPHRLRILTIDSLSSLIANQMPLLSQLGGSLAITDFAEDSYQEAARAVINYLDDADYGADLMTLLTHLDNQVERLISLLAKMLAKRDQWLRLLGAGELDIKILQEGILQIADLRLKNLQSYQAALSNLDFVAAINFAAGYIDKKTALASLKTISKLPTLAAENLTQWKAIADFCLTSSGTFRKSLNKNQGLLADKDLVGEDKILGKEIKNNLRQLFTDWSEINGFAEALYEINQLPIAQYSLEQQQLLQSLLRLLRLATVELNLDFQSRAEADFIEVALAADRALGYFDEPSELALKLDYQISHILVDEFQDTSFTQYRLLNKLIAGWQHGDGRTLFLVGDPMQSIYRFREANVGLFIQTQQQGIGDLLITPLTLKANFRSSQTIIDWVNHKFKSIFPQQEDVLLGAVAYSDAIAMKPVENNDFVKFLPQFDWSEQTEAKAIALEIEAIQEKNPEQTVAILVRGRSHAQPIMEALTQTGIAYYAKDMEYLKHKSVIHDLLAITRLLLQPQDAIGWLAFLKSPLLGINLKDITQINNQLRHNYWRLLDEYETLPSLTQEARAQLRHVVPYLQLAIAESSRKNLSRVVETLWLQLGGPHVLLSTHDLNTADAYFKVILQLEANGPIGEIGLIEKAINDLYAEQAPSINAVEIMTMHKSKGLEFDTVILPSLERRKRADDHQLLLWEEFSSNEEQHYLLAPIQAQEQSEPIYQLARDIQKKKAQLEDARLLYVAATRAKKRLILSCQLKTRFDERKDEQIYSSISPLSLLHYLKAFYQSEIEQAFSQLNFDDEIESDNALIFKDWYRLKPAAYSWKLKDLSKQTDEQLEEASIDYDWASDVARVVGLIVHDLLESIGNGHLTFSQLESRDYQMLNVKIVEYLQQPDEQKQAFNKIIKALENMQQDKNAHWILQQKQEAYCEWSISGLIEKANGEKEIKNVIIDRSFVDEKNIRWIIDYKTGEHLGADLDNFFETEKVRYQEQLDQYEFLVKQMDNREIKKALYFPMHQRLVIM